MKHALQLNSTMIYTNPQRPLQERPLLKRTTEGKPRFWSVNLIIYDPQAVEISAQGAGTKFAAYKVQILPARAGVREIS
jgi:hypothetical protein